MMGHYIVAGREMALKICGVCGVEFMMPSAFERECRKEGQKMSWHCPNGHERVYGTGEIEAVRQERDRLRQQLAERDDTIRAERERAEKAEARQARLRKRIDVGLCPCCNLSFQNLARHMKTKHGDKVVPLKAGAA